MAPYTSSALILALRKMMGSQLIKEKVARKEPRHPHGLVRFTVSTKPRVGGRHALRRQLMRDYTLVNATKWTGRQWRKVRKALQRGELD